MTLIVTSPLCTCVCAHMCTQTSWLCAPGKATSARMSTDTSVGQPHSDKAVNNPSAHVQVEVEVATREPRDQPQRTGSCTATGRTTQQRLQCDSSWDAPWNPSSSWPCEQCLQPQGDSIPNDSEVQQEGSKKVSFTTPTDPPPERQPLDTKNR